MEDLTIYQLLEHFENAACDLNYNPTPNSFNKSEFSLSELREEIIRRTNI
jgi:hypothetical protein